MAGIFNALLDALVGKDVREQFRTNLAARGNTPSLTNHFLGEDQGPEFLRNTTTLLIGELQSLLGSPWLFQFLGHIGEKERALIPGSGPNPREPNGRSILHGSDGSQTPRHRGVHERASG